MDLAKNGIFIQQYFINVPAAERVPNTPLPVVNNFCKNMQKRSINDVENVPLILK